MKRLVEIDPDTLEPAVVICTFELIDDEDRVEVTFMDEDDKAESRAILEAVHKGKLLTPADGKSYFDAIDASLRGTYRYVETVADDEDATALKAS